MPANLPDRAIDFLTKLSSYQSLIGQDDNYFGAATIVPGEELIGIYKNSTLVPTRSVLITSLGLHVHTDDSVYFIPYLEVESVQWQTWSKAELADPDNRRLIFVLSNGERMDVHVTGEHRGVMDINHMHNFLLGAVQARQLAKRRSLNRPF